MQTPSVCSESNFANSAPQIEVKKEVMDTAGHSLLQGIPCDISCSAQVAVFFQKNIPFSSLREC